MLRVQRPALLDAALGHPRIEVLGEGLDEFRLLAVQLQHTRLLLQRRHHIIHYLRCHSSCSRLSLQGFQASRKSLLCPNRNRAEQANHNNKRAQQHDTTHPERLPTILTPAGAGSKIHLAEWDFENPHTSRYTEPCTVTERDPCEP